MSNKINWENEKEELRRLYVDEELSQEEIAKIYKTEKDEIDSALKSLKILKIDKTFEIRIYHNSEGKVVRLFVNKEYHEKLLSNGWMPGWNK